MKRFAMLLLMALFALPGMTGCKSGPAQDTTEATLPDVQSSDDDALRWKATGVVAAAVVTRVWLPADQTINELWRTASTDSLSRAELRVWHDNQLRAAVVSREQLQAMLKTLPGHFGVQRQLLTLTRDMTPLEPASMAMAHRKVMLQLQGQPVPFVGGRMQLLMGADPQSQSGLKLTLVPHQYRPKVTLLPRSHVQAALDGRLFPGLMLRALLKPDQVLLIAPDVPLPRFDDTRPPPSSQPAESASQSSAESAEVSADKPAQAGKAEPPSSDAPDAPDPPDGPAASEDAADMDRSQTLEIPALSQSPDAIPFGLGQALLTGVEGRATLHQLVIIEASRISPDSRTDDGKAEQ